MKTKCKKHLLLITILFAVIFVAGCKNTEDDTIYSLKSLKAKLERKGVSDRERSVLVRIDKAISEYEDKKTDTIPILFYAGVSHPKERQEIYLQLAYYDEDSNILGLGIREKANNQYNFIEERYPIYIQQSPPPVWSSLLPIQKRTDNQRKDETAWSLYMRGEGELSYPEFMQKKGPSFLGKFKIPPIWLSLPDNPNSMPEVFVYDKDGNVSEFITIENNLN